MDTLSLLIDFLKWCAKVIASKFGYQFGEFEQIIGAYFLLLLGISCVVIFVRVFMFSS
jgi:hypothetical protein